MRQFTLHTTHLPPSLPPSFPPPLPPQIRLHDVGGIWIFLAACIGLGALWNVALWALGGSSNSTAGGRPSADGVSSDLLAGEDGCSQAFGRPVTLEASVRLARDRLIKVRAEPGL